MTPTAHDSDLRQKIRDLFEQAEPAEWVRKMIDHYRKTGAVRPEDLRRLLGDPTKGVAVGPNTSLASFLSAHDQ